MKTDDLIRAMVTDNASVQAPISRTVWLALGAGADTRDGPLLQYARRALGLCSCNHQRPALHVQIRVHAWIGCSGRVFGIASGTSGRRGWLDQVATDGIAPASYWGCST